MTTFALILTTLLAIAAVANLWYAYKSDLQMLQQNSYRNDRYFRWWKASNNYYSVNRIIDLIVLLLMLSQFSKLYVVIPIAIIALATKVILAAKKKIQKAARLHPSRLAAFDHHACSLRDCHGNGMHPQCRRFVDSHLCSCHRGNNAVGAFMGHPCHLQQSNDARRIRNQQNVLRRCAQNPVGNARIKKLSASPAAMGKQARNTTSTASLANATTC